MLVRTFKWLGMAAVLLPYVFWLNVAHAQSTSSAQNSGTQEDTSFSGLQEIVVTAQKKAERIQEVPMSITAFTTSDVRAAAINDTQDLQLRVPGLVYGEGNSFAQPYIRGVGSSFASTGLETSIATYVDDVYIQQQTGAISQLVDLTEVEVLKGPQGTLYGRNATGGAIIVRTADPTDVSEGRVMVGYGNYGEIKSEAVFNIPLSEHFSLRLAAQVDDRTKGYIHNDFTGRELGQDYRNTGRVKLAWKPGEGTEVVATVEVFRNRDGADAQAQGLRAVCTSCNIFGFYPSTQFYHVDVNNQTSVLSNYNTANIHATTAVGDLKLSSVTSYRRYFFGGSFDQDFTPANLLNYVTTNTSRTFEQEFRVASQYSGPINFLTGVFFEHDKSDAPASLPGLAFPGGTPASTTNEALLNAGSIFGEAYLNATDKLKFTVGGRYNHDNRELTILNNAAGAAAFGAAGFSESKSFSDFTPRAVVAYNDGDLNLYASYGKGFKSGGFNALVFTKPNPVNSEKLTSYEIGGKFEFLNRTIRLNTSIFYYKYDDMQVTFFDPVTSATFLKNAANSTIRGADVDLTWAATRELTLSAGGGYLHAKFDSFPDGSVYVPGGGSYVVTTQDLSGRNLPYSPMFSGYLSGTYTRPVSSSLETGLSAIVNYSDHYDFMPAAGGPLALDHQNPLTRVNLTGSVGTIDHKWIARFYVENLTNREYYNARFAVGFGDQITYALPRTYGGSLEYRF